MAAKLAFYVGQTKKDYTNAIKEDLKTLDANITTLEKTLETVATKKDIEDAIAALPRYAGEII